MEFVSYLLVIFDAKLYFWITMINQVFTLT